MLRGSTAHRSLSDEQLAYITSEISRLKNLEMSGARTERSVHTEDRHAIPSHPGGEARLELVGSSNGCASFVAYLVERTVKCYECPTARRAAIIQYLSEALRAEGVEMPECFAVQGNIVLAEWV